MTHNNFASKVKAGNATIAIVGLGYVGLPLAIGFCGAGLSVLGLDINATRVADLMAGKSHISQFPDSEIRQLVESGRFQASTDFAVVENADAILICVPTPLTRHKDPDLSFIEATARAIAPHLVRGQLVVLESTTYPGTTREVMRPLLEQGSGMVAEKDFFIAYSPEREDPGNEKYGATTTPKVVGGLSEASGKMAAELYEKLTNKVVPVSDADTAEAVKLTENIFRAVNIAMVNELKLIYDDMGIDVWEVIEAAATKPFGFMPFYPGPGLGGHCIPIDPFYLTWKAREFGRNTRFIELAGMINTAMPAHVVSRLAGALSRKHKKALNGAKVLVVGVAYKKNVNDTRESPALEIMELLREEGAEIAYHDPFVPEIPTTREHTSLAGMKSVPWCAEEIGRYDAALIVTNHDNIDWELLVHHAPLIVDTRNVLSPWGDGDKIVKA